MGTKADRVSVCCIVGLAVPAVALVAQEVLLLEVPSQRVIVSILHSRMTQEQSTHEEQLVSSSSDLRALRRSCGGGYAGVLVCYVCVRPVTDHFWLPSD